MNINFYIAVVVIIFYSSINAQQSDWKVFNTSNSGLPDNQIQSIYIDENNVKWIGTSSGLVRFDDSGWAVYDTTNSGLPSNYVTSIDGDGSKGIWIGTDKGIVHRGFGIWNVYTTDNSILPSSIILKVKYAGGASWFCTDKGLVKFERNEWTLFNSETSMLAVDFICSVTVDLNGKLWVGAFDHDSFNGFLWMFDGADWKYFRLKDHGMFSSFPDALICDSNNELWLGTKGTSGGAVVKINGNDWTVYDKNNSLYPGGGINSIAGEGEGKWIAAGSGLIYFKNGIWTLYNNNNSGLPDDFVSDIAIDQYGNKWIATIGGGLAVFKKGGIISSTENGNADILNKFTLYDNYPNPFNPATTIKYYIPKSANVTLKVFDVLGNCVAALVNENQTAGNYHVNFVAQNLSSGIYFYRIEAGSFSQVKKFILMK